MLFHNHKGQSTLEYCVLIVIVLACFLAMQNYIKRGLMGNMKDASDRISENHFSPGNTEVEILESDDTFTTENFGDLGANAVGAGVTNVGESRSTLRADRANDQKNVTISRSMVTGHDEFYGSQENLDGQPGAAPNWATEGQLINQLRNRRDNIQYDE